MIPFRYRFVKHSLTLAVILIKTTRDFELFDDEYGVATMFPYFTAFPLTEDSHRIKFLNDPLGEERYWCGDNNDREQMHKDIREYAREIMGIDVPRFTDLVEDTKSKTIFLVRASRPTLPKRIRIDAGLQRALQM
ncbi:MAG: hypothetical protein CMP20_04925 [Rickettsiales bacterium]|nr:hypothetical protein [Rickettsiales bacterium]